MRANEKPISTAMPFYPGESSRRSAPEKTKRRKKADKKLATSPSLIFPRGELAKNGQTTAGKLGVGALLIDRNV